MTTTTSGKRFRTITAALALAVSAITANAETVDLAHNDTGTITGVKNTDVITASYSTTADATSPAGTYPITPTPDASPALSNYAITLINGTLTLQ